MESLQPSYAEDRVVWPESHGAGPHSNLTFAWDKL